MFTLGVFYFILYTISMLSLFFLSFLKFPIYCLTTWSMSTFILFLNKYTKLREIFLFFIFILTGLPPFGLFFVKFNILAFILYQAHLIIICLIFILFFLNMLYYTQVFNIKNHKKKLYNVFDDQFFFLWNSSNTKLSTFDNYTNYSIINLLTFFCLVLLITIFVYSDLFLILSL